MRPLDHDHSVPRPGPRRERPPAGRPPADAAVHPPVEKARADHPADRQPHNGPVPPLSPPSGTDLQALDAGCAALLPRIGYAYEMLDLLGLDPEDRPRPTARLLGADRHQRSRSLYARMFLNPTVLSNEQRLRARHARRHPRRRSCSPFAAAQDSAVRGAQPDQRRVRPDHRPAARARLRRHHRPDPGNITAIYRRGWLARTLGISALELLSLLHYTGIDPFTLPAADAAQPFRLPLLGFCQLAQSLSAAGLQPVQALYLLWNVDLSGISAPPTGRRVGPGRIAARGLAAVDASSLVTGSLTPDRAKSLMALVLGTAAADVFFGLVNGTFLTSTPFAYLPAALPQAVIDSSRGSLGYDDLAKQLTFAGYLDPPTLASMQAAAAGDTALLAGLTALAAAHSQAVDAFFATNDSPTLGLRSPFDSYANSSRPGSPRRPAGRPDARARQPPQEGASTHAGRRGRRLRSQLPPGAAHRPRDPRTPRRPRPPRRSRTSPRWPGQG